MTDEQKVIHKSLDKVIEEVILIRTEGKCDFPLQYDRQVVWKLLQRLVDELAELKKKVNQLDDPHYRAGHYD